MHQVLNHGRGKKLRQRNELWYKYMYANSFWIWMKKKWRKNLEPIQWTLYYMYMTTYYSDFHKECFSERKKNVICDCSCNNTVVLAASRIYTDVKETVALVTMTTVDIGLRPRLIASTCLVQLRGVCIWQHVWK